MAESEEAKAVKSLTGSKTDGSSLNKSLRGLTSSIKNLSKTSGREQGAIVKLTAVMWDVGKTVSGFINSFMRFAPEVENLAAKFSMPFDILEKQSKDLAETFKEEKIPASVFDIMKMGLHATSIGLHKNSKEMRNLFHSTLVTGENFRQLIKEVGLQTIGTKNQTEATKSLFVALDETSLAFNMSREQLVKAMNLLSKDTKNLLIATGAGPTKLNEVFLRLAGTMGEGGDKIIEGLSKQVNRMFTPEGMQMSFALDVPLAEMIKGNLSVKETLVELIKMTDNQLSKMNVNGVASIPFLKAIEAYFGDLGSAQAFHNRVMQRLSEEGIDTANKSAEEIAGAIFKLSKESKEAKKKFSETWDMVKKQIMLPLAEEALKFFKWFKPFVSNNKDILTKAFKSVGTLMFATGMLIVTGIQELAGWLAGQNNKWVLMLKGAMKDLQASVVDFKEENYKLSKDAQDAAAKAHKDKKDENEKKKSEEMFKAIGKGFSIHQSRIMEPGKRKPGEVIVKDKALSMGWLKRGLEELEKAEREKAKLDKQAAKTQTKVVKAVEVVADRVLDQTESITRNFGAHGTQSRYLLLGPQRTSPQIVIPGSN